MIKKSDYSRSQPSQFWTSMGAPETFYPVLSRLSPEEVKLIRAYRASLPVHRDNILLFALTAAADTALEMGAPVIPLFGTK
jgi:hypothetical protein